MGQLLYVIFDLVAHVLMISPSVFSPYAQTYYNRTNLILQFDPYQPGGNTIKQCLIICMGLCVRSDEWRAGRKDKDAG